MARKKGLDDATLDEQHAPPLPLEAEEGAVQLKWGQMTAVIFGAVFLAIALYMIFLIIPVLQQHPGLQYPEIPILSVAFFVVGAVGDLAVAVTARPGALRLWHQGKFAESDKFLLGWRAYLTVVAGGVLPGFFLFRASDRLQPLIDLQHGGLPPPGMYPAHQPPAMGAPPPTMSMGYGNPPPGAPYSPGPAPPPYAPGPGGPRDDSVAPNPFGGPQAAPGPNAPSPYPGPQGPWARPNVAPYPGRTTPPAQPQYGNDGSPPPS